MSILIKGMEMPTSCWDCEVGATCPFYSMEFWEQENYQDKIADGCPLVHIPPHGRMIDADEFLKRAIGTKCFRGDYALMLEELVGESTTILEAEEGE